MPLKNGEGRYHADEATLDALEAEGRVVVRYLDNPNGSGMKSDCQIACPAG